MKKYLSTSTVLVQSGEDSVTPEKQENTQTFMSNIIER